MESHNPCLASGNTVRALLYNNVICCVTASRPLISVGQLRAMLDIRFIWSNSAPLLVVCSGGLKYVLVESSVIHHLPMIITREMNVILEALDQFTNTGTRPHGRRNWVANLHCSIGLLLLHLSNYLAMMQLLLMILRWCSRPCRRTIHLGELSRKWMRNRYFHPCRFLLDQLLLLDLYLLHLQMLYPQLRSWLTRWKNRIHQPKMRSWQAWYQEKVGRRERWKPQNRSTEDRGGTLGNTSQSSIHDPQGRDRKEDRSHSIEGTDFTRNTARSAMARGSTKKSDKNVRFTDFGCHTTSFTCDLESVQTSVDALLNHRLPKARQRTNVVTNDYTPRGRLFGGYTTRGEGVTIASYRFPQVVSAIHAIASTRHTGFTEEPYLAAQLNAATSLPVHKDKNNEGFTWLIAFGDFSGGRLWIESPVGTHPPPNPRNAVEQKLSGEYLPGFLLILNFTMLSSQSLLVIECHLHSLRLRDGRGFPHIAWMNWLTLVSTTPHSVHSTQFSHDEVATSSGSASSTLPDLPTSLADSMENSDLATLIFGPMPAEAMTFSEPQPEEQELLQEWCKTDLVSLPFASLPASDGSIAPLSEKELEELSEHIRSGHSS